MAIRYSLIISNQVCDLFQEETITLTRQVKDLSDLAQAKTDFTQQFVIPASPINDQIFQNYFDENVEMGNWNAFLKLDAQIYINGMPTFTGCVELTGVTYKNGLPRSYNIIFYSNSKSAYSSFADKTLMDLDWSYYTHLVNYGSVTDSWSGGLFGGAILWPIADWNIGYVYSSKYKVVNNIGSSTNGGILINDLRPSIRLREMIQTIFSNIGYTISGTLLARSEFDKLYVAPMGTAGPIQNPNNDMAKFEVTESTYISPSTVAFLGYQKLSFSTVISNPSGSFDIVNDQYNAPYNGEYTFEFNFNISIPISPGLTIVTFAILKNGLYVNSGYNVTTSGIKNFSQTIYLNKGDKVTIGYMNSGNFTLISADFKCIKVPYGLIDSYLDLKSIMPNTKVVDFLSSFLKSFNAVMVSNSGKNIELHNIDDWYALGTTKDWTKYIDVTDISHEKTKIPKSVSMKHQEGKDMANQQFLSLYNRRFGEIEFAPNVNFASDELAIETQFTIPVPSITREINDIGQVIGNTDIQMMVMLDKDSKPVQQNFLMFFFAGVKTATQTYYLESNGITNYPLCSSYDAFPTTSSTNSLAFGLETTIEGDMPTKTMFMNYFVNYLSRLYSSKSRIVKITAIIPVKEWQDLSLNDTLAISSNYYKIQSIQYDILQQKAQMELLTYQDVDIIQLGSTGNKPTWVDAGTKPVSGLTLIGNGIMGHNLGNGHVFDGTYYTDVIGQDSYNNTNIQATKTITNQLFDRFRLTQVLLYTDTSNVVNLIGESYVELPYNQSQVIGEIDKMTIGVNSITINLDGQYRITSTISHSHSGNRDYGFLILVNDQPSYAKALVFNINGTETLTCIGNFISGQVVKIVAFSQDTSSYAIVINYTTFSIESL